MKLTRVQKTVLLALSGTKRGYVVLPDTATPTGDALSKMGFAVKDPILSGSYRITEAGRAYLAQQKERA